MLPKKYQISKHEAILGAVNRYGYSKWITEDDIELNTLLSILNGHKPIAISSLYEIHKIYVLHPKLKKICKGIWKKDIIIYWYFDKYYIRAKLFKKWYYNIHVSKPSKIIKFFQPFIFDYISGKLLGYRDGEIKGYLINEILYKKIGKVRYNKLMDLPELYIDEFPQYKKQLKWFKKIRKEFINTSTYRKIMKKYPMFKKKCNRWIKLQLWILYNRFSYNDILYFLRIHIN